MLYLLFISQYKVFNQFTLLIRWSAAVLKVGVPCGLRSLYMAYSKNFSSKQLYITSTVIYIVGLNKRIKFICVAMCSIVCSHDWLMTSFNTLNSTLNN